MKNFSQTILDLPRPYPEKKFYENVLSEGFKAFPERERNFKLFQTSKRNEEVKYLPIKLDIENVSRCNYHCTMCSVSSWPKYKRARDMSLTEFKNIIDEQIGLTEIKIQGLGEPFLSNDFIPMVEYARSKHIWVRSTNNASRLDIKENYKRIIDADICELQVSIDGGTKETFEKIRAGSRFERVLKNCNLLNEYALRKNRLRTRAWTLVQKDNFDELEKIVLLCEKTGFKRLTFSMDVEDTAWENESKNHIKDIDRKEKLNLITANHLIQLGKSKSIEVTFWMSFEKYNFKKEEELCPWPFERAVISSDMRVVPCCMIANPDIFELGNGDNFKKIWHSKIYRNFRKSHLNGTIPSVCKNCYSNN